MSVALLDVNVLIALAWPTHIHNGAARTWFAQRQSDGWATCPITQCAFVRLSSNPKLLQPSVETAEAVALLQRIVALDNHIFWNDAIPFSSPAVPKQLLVSHRQITDAYLLGLAKHNNGKLVTFDKGISALLSDASAHKSCLVVIEI